ERGSRQERDGQRAEKNATGRHGCEFLSGRTRLYSRADARSQRALVLSVTERRCYRRPTDCILPSAPISNGAWLTRSCVVQRRRTFATQTPPAYFTCRRRVISAAPPCMASSSRNTSPASRAIASATAAIMRRPFSAVACCGLPNQPVGAIERMSVSTGWELRGWGRFSLLWAGGGGGG